MDIGAASLVSRRDLCEGADGRIKFDGKEPDELGEDVIAQVGRGRLDGAPP